MEARNRPRSTIVKEDLADEFQLWHSIVDKIRRCAAVHKKFEDVSANIPGVEEEMIGRDRTFVYFLLLHYLMVL